MKKNKFSHFIADCLKKAAGKNPKPRTSAVIVAAGNSTRMGGTVSKQFFLLSKMPVLARTLRAFEDTALIREIVVVARPEDFGTIESMARTYGITKLTRVVKGGETRALSVKNGFDRISPESDFVAIHDGARCLVTPEMIENVCRAAYRHKAASAVAPITDTIKTSNPRGFIKASLDRKKVFSATTPQVFSADLYRGAFAICKNPEDLTDDNQLLEKLPFPVKMVDCGRENIKLTLPVDLYLAEGILKYREEQNA